jgi:hypothetical protein
MGNSILGISSQKNQGDLSKNKVADDPVSSLRFRLVRTRPSIVEYVAPSYSCGMDSVQKVGNKVP